MYAIEAVGVLGPTSGLIDVLRKDTIRPVTKGFILQDQDLIVTDRNSKAVVNLLDGSELKLFQSTHFKIIQLQEQQGPERIFHNIFELRRGTLWGYFPVIKQISIIKTPSAEIITRGSFLSLNQTRLNLDITVSRGALTVENESQQLEISGGSLVRSITLTEKFQDRLQQIPYLLQITPQEKSIRALSQKGSKRFYFTFQLLNRLTNENLNREGTVHIMTEKRIIKFPKVKLNKKGFARVFTRIYPFETGKNKNRSIKIYATMEGNRFFDVGLGETQLLL